MRHKNLQAITTKIKLIKLIQKDFFPLFSLNANLHFVIYVNPFKVHNVDALNSNALTCFQAANKIVNNFSKVKHQSTKLKSFIDYANNFLLPNLMYSTFVVASISF